MRDVSNRNFGLLIAYLVPGFVALWGVSFVEEDLRVLLRGPAAEGPTIGGFLYVTVGSVAAGMIANALRWAAIDTAHHFTGLERPLWTDAALHERVAAYDWLVENHYRHYQFYGNTLIAVLFAYFCWRLSLADASPGVGWLDGAVVALSIVLAAGSRSTLTRYYRRAESLLGTHSEGETAMANGGHPAQPKSEPKPDPKDKTKPTQTRVK